MTDLKKTTGHNDWNVVVITKMINTNPNNAIMNLLTWIDVKIYYFDIIIIILLPSEKNQKTLG